MLLCYTCKLNNFSMILYIAMSLYDIGLYTIVSSFSCLLDMFAAKLHSITISNNQALVRPIHILCKSELCAFCAVQSMDWAGNSWIVVQSMGPFFLQHIPRIVNPCFAPNIVSSRKSWTLWSVPREFSPIPHKYPLLTCMPITSCVNKFTSDS